MHTADRRMQLYDRHSSRLTCAGRVTRRGRLPGEPCVNCVMASWHHMSQVTHLCCCSQNFAAFSTRLRVHTCRDAAQAPAQPGRSLAGSTNPLPGQSCAIQCVHVPVAGCPPRRRAAASCTPHARGSCLPAANTVGCQERHPERDSTPLRVHTGAARSTTGTPSARH